MTNYLRRNASTDRRPAEHWFLSHGLPAVLRPGVLLRRIWPRSAPALAAFAVTAVWSAIVVMLTGEHTIDINGSPTRTQWFVLMILILTLPAAGLTGWLVSRIRTDRGRILASTASALVGFGASFIGGPSPRALVNVSLEMVAVAIILLCTATGLGSVLGLGAQLTTENLASIGTLLLRALPVMLLTVLVFFNSPVWTMVSTISRPRLWGALTFLFVIAATFLISSTLARVRPILAPDAKSDADPAALAGTPFENLPDRPYRIPLSKPERVNIVLVVAIAQIVQVLTVALVTGGLFLVLGLILLSPELLDAWTHGGSPDGQFLTMTVPVPNALIQITMFLTALTFMYLAARAVTDNEYREEFTDPLLLNVQQALVARDRYRTATARR